jgi:hypothetical protein
MFSSFNTALMRRGRRSRPLWLLAVFKWPPTSGRFSCGHDWPVWVVTEDKRVEAMCRIDYFQEMRTLIDGQTDAIGLQVSR